MPTKTLLTIGDDLYYPQHPRFEALRNGHKHDIAFDVAVREKDEIVASARERNYVGVIDHLEGVDYMEGRGRFVSENEVEVTGETIRGGKFVVAVGSSTRPPSIPGIDKVSWHTNRTIMDLGRAPESLIVLGGGPEGLEFAQMFAHFGVRVTVIAAKGHQVLRREEPEIVDEIVRNLAEEGIRFILDADVKSLSESAGRKVVTVSGAGGEERVEAEALLVATGVQANTSDMGLEIAGVTTVPGGFVRVNERYQTDNPAIFAAGDCIGRMPLETVAAKEGALAVENALTGVNRSIDYDHVPHAVFTNPQVASVGITEEEEMRRFNACSCRTIYMDAVPKADATRETRGVFKMVIHPETSKVLGVHIVAPHAADLIHEATLAVKFGLTVDDIIDTLHVFPTLSEGIKRVAQAFTRDISVMSCCIE
jgi:mercuric reductase